jgi:hypothetical protein
MRAFSAFSEMVGDWRSALMRAMVGRPSKFEAHDVEVLPIQVADETRFRRSGRFSGLVIALILHAGPLLCVDAVGREVFRGPTGLSVAGREEKRTRQKNDESSETRVASRIARGETPIRVRFRDA